MNTRFAFTLMMLLVAAQAAPCSIVGFQPFIPEVDRFKPKYDRDGSNERLPTPVPKLIGVQRGSTGAGASCSDAGIVQVELGWPQDSAYRIEEVGFYFRVVSVHGINDIFPAEPIIGTRVRNRFVFAWLDGHPSEQRAVDIRVEVFAVNNGLQIGPSAYFEIKAAPGEVRGPQLVPTG
ncbi:MAG TPA: hypothetical protein VGQ52_01695 [Gemmatimonadaceae bacterium]|jgi:hypothetical protein|nr:hypothetical protein [Gemmatimonadaceae bacterium]